ncbi:MAG: [protein-PII] uridylyltransferase, partial [Pseudomonadota bacterium]
MGPHAQSTLPPAASAPPEAEPDWPTLGLSRRDVLDPGALFAEIATADDPRPTARKILRAALKDGRAKLAERVAAAPLASGEAAAAYTHLADGMVTTAFDIARRLLHPAHAPTRGERLAVVLVGGSGRGEMAPFSDIDLLFLTPWKTTPWAESVIESTLYILWDLKLKLGHSVRTVDECLRQARGDMTIRTALLEHRHLAGAAPLTEELSSRLWTEVIARTGPDFVEAKLEERDQRHRRTGGTRFLVEPNVKESKGGLRDLQTLYWIAKYVERARSVEDLVERGVFDAAEMKIFQEAEAFLWAVRIQLHLLAGRAVEVLSFDMQVEVAAALGFDDAPGLRGVERFMQAYFSHARHVGALTRIFLTDLEAQHVKKRPSIRRTLQRLGLGTERVGDAYRVVNGRLDLVDADILTSDPINMLRYLEEGIRTGILLHPNGMRQIALNIDLIDDRVRADPEANEIFVRLVHESADPVRALRRMHELGLLSAFLPPFGRITAMMQYNMYHRYTVDEHTIQCIHELNKIVAGRRREVLPLASQIVEKGVNLRVLSIALLFHDIGKGRAEDHSIVGADIAEELCPRLGLLPEECEAVVWLVRNHLVMSDTAQKRDLADARTIADFASLVGSPTRLRLLLVLTVCDIRGVGPGVWNNWKAQLFRHLYRQTLEVLTGTVDPRSMRQRVGEAKAAFRQALPDWSTEALDTECARHYDAFWLGLDLDTQLSLIEIQGASTS